MKCHCVKYNLDYFIYKVKHRGVYEIPLCVKSNYCFLFRSTKGFYETPLCVKLNYFSVVQDRGVHKKPLYLKLHYFLFSLT